MAASFRPQRFDDLIGRQRALRARHELDLQPSAVGRPRRRRPSGADGRRDRLDVRVGLDDFHDRQLVLDHRRVAQPLRHLGLAVELAGVLARDEAHRDDAEAVHRRRPAADAEIAIVTPMMDHRRWSSQP